MIEVKDFSIAHAAVDPDVVKKLPYSPPELKEFGSVSKLTLGGGATSADGVNSTKKSTGSDRRIKDNIVRVGDHPLGIGLYLFTYKPEHQGKWGAGRQLGVMADEVEVVLPEAVIYGTDGFASVDYRMLVTKLDKTTVH